MVKSKTWIEVEELDPENFLGLEYDRDTEKEMLQRIEIFNKEAEAEKTENTEELEVTDEEGEDDGESVDETEEEIEEDTGEDGDIMESGSDSEEEIPEAEEVTENEEEDKPNLPSVNGDDIEYPCQFCDEIFDDTAKLVVHQEEVHMCHTKGCGFYGTIEELKAHIDEEAVEADKVDCPDENCEYRGTQDEVDAHIEDEHKSEEIPERHRNINRFRNRHNKT